MNWVQCYSCNTILLFLCNCIYVFIYFFVDSEFVEIDIPLIDQSFIGTGDFFTALLLIWMNLTNNDLKKSMEKTVATVQAVLERTMKCK